MSNREKILKYLSELMTPEEEREFEILLEQDKQLRKEFDAINGKLETLKSDSEPELNQTYLANLLPRARSKMESKKSGILFGIKFAPQLTAVVFLILSALFFSNGFNNNALTFDELQKFLSSSNLTAQDLNRLDLILEENDFDLLSVNSEDIDLTNEFNAFGIKPSDVGQLDFYDVTGVEDYEYLNNLSESDFKKITNEIKE